MPLGLVVGTVQRRAGAARVAIARSFSSFLDGGPASSEDGDAYIRRRRSETPWERAELIDLG
jgi:hypothetical protein